MLLFLAWASLLLPWESCRADCHARVLPAGIEHACHGAPCDPPCDGHDEGQSPDPESTEHERVQADSTSPRTGDTREGPASLSRPVATTLDRAPAAGRAGPVPPRPPRAWPAATSVVLLL